MVDKKEQKQKEEEDAKLKSPYARAKKGKIIPKRKNPPFLKGQDHGKKCRHNT